MNRRAIWALVLAVAAGRARLPARRHDAGRQVADPGVLDTLYTYAWFVTFALSAALYLVLSKRATRT